MAHKKAKTTGTGADGGKSRYMTRAEAKDGARVHRRREDATSASGYRDCACRDCFEIAIGAPGAFCHACVDAEGDHPNTTPCSCSCHNEEE